MKVKVIKAFRDKITKSVLKPGQIIEVTEERFGDLTGPFGIFVEEIEEEPPAPPSGNETGEDITPSVDPQKEEGEHVESIQEPPTVPKFEYMNKTEIVEYAKGLNIELNMEMSKVEMIEILLKK